MNVLKPTDLCYFEKLEFKVDVKFISLKQSSNNNDKIP